MRLYYYSNEMLQAAKDCSATITDDERLEALKSGMQAFDRHEKERGHDYVCYDVLKTFPNIVRE